MQSYAERGRIQGKENVDNGHVTKIQSMGGRVQGPVTGKKWGPINIRKISKEDKSRRGKLVDE